MRLEQEGRGDEKRRKKMSARGTVLARVEAERGEERKEERKE